MQSRFVAAPPRRPAGHVRSLIPGDWNVAIAVARFGAARIAKALVRATRSPSSRTPLTGFRIPVDAAPISRAPRERPRRYRSPRKRWSRQVVGARLFEEATVCVMAARQEFADRAHRGRRCWRRQRARAGLPQTCRGEARLRLGVVPQFVQVRIDLPFPGARRLRGQQRSRRATLASAPPREEARQGYDPGSLLLRPPSMHPRHDDVRQTAGLATCELLATSAGDAGLQARATQIAAH